MPTLSWILPYRKHVYDTVLSPAEVAEQLGREVTFRADNLLFFSSDIATPYVGSYSAEGFDVRRVIGYRNSFLPMIKGSIEVADFGARVTVTMRPMLFVLIFMAVWLSFAGLGCLAVTVAMIQQGFAPQLLVPFGMVVAGVAMVSLGFGLEARKSERWLRDLLPPYEPAATVGPYR